MSLAEGGCIRVKEMLLCKLVELSYHTNPTKALRKSFTNIIIESEHNYGIINPQVGGVIYATNYSH